MKTIKLFLKPITYLLVFLILFQGCTVYKKQNISLDQAVENNGKVKLITKSNDKYKFKYITIVDGEYFGVVKRKGEIINYQLQEKNIKAVKPKSKAASIAITTLALIPVSILVLFAASGGYM